MQSPPGTVIGYVQQDCSFVYPWFSVRNAEEETVLRIKGPCSTCKYCEFEFEVRERVCPCSFKVQAVSANTHCTY